MVEAAHEPEKGPYTNTPMITRERTARNLDFGGEEKLVNRNKVAHKPLRYSV